MWNREWFFIPRINLPCDRGTRVKAFSMAVQYLNTTGWRSIALPLEMKCRQPTFIFRAGRLVQKLASRCGGARKWWRECRICIILKEFHVSGKKNDEEARKRETGRERGRKNEEGEAAREEARTMIKKKARRAETKRATQGDGRRPRSLIHIHQAYKTPGEAPGRRYPTYLYLRRLPRTPSAARRE